MKLKTIAGVVIAAAVFAGLQSTPTHAASTESLCKVDPLKRGASLVSMTGITTCRLTYTSPTITSKSTSRRASGIANQVNSTSQCKINSSRGDNANVTAYANGCNVPHTTKYDGTTRVSVTYRN